MCSIAHRIRPYNTPLTPQQHTSVMCSIAHRIRPYPNTISTRHPPTHATPHHISPTSASNTPLDNPTTPQPRNPTTPQHHNTTTPQHHNSTTPQLHNTSKPAPWLTWLQPAAKVPAHSDSHPNQRPPHGQSDDPNGYHRRVCAAKDGELRGVAHPVLPQEVPVEREELQVRIFRQPGE